MYRITTFNDFHGSTKFIKIMVYWITIFKDSIKVMVYSIMTLKKSIKSWYIRLRLFKTLKKSIKVMMYWIKIFINSLKVYRY